MLSEEGVPNTWTGKEVALVVYSDTVWFPGIGKWGLEFTTSITYIF